MVHKSTVSLSQAQKGKAAEVSFSQQHGTQDDEALSSVKEVTYSDLLPSLQKLKEGCEQQHYTIPSENTETESKEADTSYNIITIEQLQL